MTADSDPFPYMESVANGFVTGIAYHDGVEEVGQEALIEHHYSGEQLLDAAGEPVTYDVTHDMSDTYPDCVSMVQIDTDLGIVDIFNGTRDPEHDGRYTLLGLLADDGETTAYLGGEQQTLPQSGREMVYGSQWGPHGAAAYDALASTFDLEPETVRVEDTIQRIDDGQVGVDDVRLTPRNYDEKDARKDLKMLDQAFHRLNDQRVASLPEFEELGEAGIGKEHPFNRTEGGPCGNEAARHFAHRFNSLYNANILDYTIAVDVNTPGKDARISIREDLDDDIRTVSGFLEDGDLTDDAVTALVDARYED